MIATQKPFASVAVEGMREIIMKAGLEFLLLEKYASQSDFIDAVKDVDALIVRSELLTATVCIDKYFSSLCTFCYVLIIFS